MDSGHPRFFSRPGLAALLFGVGLALFSPPLLGIPAGSSNAALWIYLFTAWAMIIAVLAGMAAARAPHRAPAAPPPAPAPSPVPDRRGS